LSQSLTTKSAAKSATPERRTRSSAWLHFKSSSKNIARLAFKVERRALQEADRTKREERVQFTRENYRIMRERLLKIIYWKPEDSSKPPASREVNEAAKNIVMMDLAILQAEAACRDVQEAVRGTREGNPLRAAAGGGAHRSYCGVAAWGTGAEIVGGADGTCCGCSGLIRTTAMAAIAEIIAAPAAKKFVRSAIFAVWAESARFSSCSAIFKTKSITTFSLSESSGAMKSLCPSSEIAIPSLCE
jgi:hypothetical protein